MKQQPVFIRRLRKEEIPLLKVFLYEAIFVPEGAESPPREILEKPELRVYTDGFGAREADNCLVADRGGKAVGAVWTRIMDDYGHVDDETPSFAISLLPEYRGRGIGTRLMEEMLALLKSEGFARASLAVQKANYALRMYRNVGFQIVGENAEEYIMVCDLRAWKPRKGSVLETERLRLRRFGEEDAERLYRCHLDAEVRRWIPNESYESLEEAREAIAFYARRADRKTLPYVLAVELKETGEWIGDVGVNEVEGRPGEAEIGYAIRPERRGQGLATEAVGAMTALAFSAFQAETLYGRVLRGNEASVRVLEKNGYRLVAEETGAKDDPYGRGMLVWAKRAELRCDPGEGRACAPPPRA